ncbi:single-stranded DNA-binding protein [Frondihabitans sp. VKM Ac-2883]|uniref:single-stranded DNA-binding protein n=1 Tax=Frondihabitans sp. VKM Ac-2883 TaxID=2783823 RepID=UPI00188B1543|nr:single-stranded DNA-binding protein [Frondihabitans sp. VKM Ac-2883]MBF4576681.1 single-stranded DNA-binding protein [Frondihabitans sp. VKM Ac-2883]
MTDTISLTGTIATPLKRVSTTSGISLVTFRLASSQRRYDRSRAVWVDSDTNWYSVSVYRQLADHADASLDKGDRVFVSGRLRIRNWQKDDRSGTSVEIDAESLGPDLLFGTTAFTKAAGRAAPAPGAAEEHDENATDPQQLPPQDPSGHLETSVTTAAPGSGSEPGVPSAPPPPTHVAVPAAAPVLVPAASTSPCPVDQQPGWHVVGEEAPF